MNADTIALKIPSHSGHDDTAISAEIPVPPIPDYLHRYYWWAYVHPNAVRVFERTWLVDLILWGNFRRLSEAALTALGETLPGRSLQIACVYGNLTNRIAARAAPVGGEIDVVDVLPVQLANLRRKLTPGAPVTLHQQDSSHLEAPDATYDRALLFFLLHEQPIETREQTVREALRVLRPGGQLVVVDFAQPRWWHPIAWFWLPILRVLEPFAASMWSDEALSWLPVKPHSRTGMFGNLYQLVTVIRE